MIKEISFLYGLKNSDLFLHEVEAMITYLKLADIDYDVAESEYMGVFTLYIDDYEIVFDVSSGNLESIWLYDSERGKTLNPGGTNDIEYSICKMKEVVMR